MKVKTADLNRHALNWAVAKADGRKVIIDKFGQPKVALPGTSEQDSERGHGFSYYRPSTDWLKAGPIIERERISVAPLARDWEATLDLDEGDAMVQVSVGPTPLIAAMRCFVASKLGEEIEVPDNLFTAFVAIE